MGTFSGESAPTLSFCLDFHWGSTQKKRICFSWTLAGTNSTVRLFLNFKGKISFISILIIYLYMDE